MTDFTSLYDCSELNLVGIPIVEFLPILGIASFNVFELRDGRLSGEINLKSGFRWLKMPIRLLEADKQFWEESKSITTQGIITDLKIQGILPMQSVQVQAQLDDMERQKFIVRIEDMNEQKFVLGSLKFPLSFQSNWSSTRGIHTVEWRGKQPHKAIGY